MKCFALATCLVVTSLLPMGARAQCVIFSEMDQAPPASSWIDRNHRLDTSLLIEMRARVQSEGQPDRVIELTNTPAGTVGCLIKKDDQCEAMRSLKLSDMPVGLLFDLLTAQINPTQDSLSSTVLAGSTQSWTLPSQHTQGNTRVIYSDWAYNPEIGMPMPQTVRLEQSGQASVFEIERFYRQPSH